MKPTHGLFLLALPALLMAQAGATDTREQRMPLAAKSREPAYEALMAMRSRRITRALQSPESLFAFVTRPEPFYLERRAAAMQGKGLIPVDWVPRLWRAIAELRRAEGEHAWRLKPHPMSAVAHYFALFPNSAAPMGARTILGHRWTPPKDLLEYPLTPRERERAPWPWQAQQALADLYGGLVPSTYAPLEREKAGSYLAAVLTMPCGTDDEAKLLVQATQYSSHFKTPAVMGALRNIAMNPNLPLAAVQVTSMFADATRLWDDPASWAIGNAGMLDILRGSPHAAARDNAVYGIRSLREAFRSGRTTRRPLPAAVILEVSQRALNPATGTEWTRFYADALSVVEALDNPPFPAGRGVDPASPLVAERLAAFGVWFDAERPRLEALAREQAAEVERGARALDTPKCHGDPQEIRQRRGNSSGYAG